MTRTEDPFKDAFDRLLPPERSPTEHADSPPSEAVSFRSGAWQMATRRVRRGQWLHPLDPVWWQGWEDTIETGTIAEIDALIAHPHPGIRQLVATHPVVWRDVRKQTVNDEWPEVRASALRNPRLEPVFVDQLCADPVRGVAALASVRRDHGSGAEALDGCVECGRPIRNGDFRTCSIQCSIDQRERRVASGFWVDAIAADFRYSTGLRSDWPAHFIWPVAATPASGGIPGTGPHQRETLVSFVRGVSAAEIVEFAAAVRQAGLDQREVLNMLAVAGHERPGNDVLADAANVLDVAWKPSPFRKAAG